jgi:hypothetical protein
MPSVTPVNVPTWTNPGPQAVDLSQDGTRPQGVQNDVGAINGVAIDPNYPSRMFVGTVSGGIWGTTDAYNPANTPDWTPLGDNLPILAIGAIALSPVDSNTIFAAPDLNSSTAGTAGTPPGSTGFVYRSTNSGGTWQVLGQSYFKPNDLFLQIVPTQLTADGTANTEVVFATTRTDGIWRSTDGGFNWSQVLSGSNDSLAADPANPQQYFAAIPGQGVFQSSSAGAAGSWTSINLNIPTLDSTFVANSIYIQLAVHDTTNQPSGSFALFASALQPDSTHHVFQATNVGTGGSWTRMDDTPKLNYGSFVADPNNPNLVYISGKPYSNPNDSFTNGARILVGNATAAAGSQWTSIAGPTVTQGTAPHADSRFMTFDANGNLVETDDGGIYRLGFGSFPHTWVSLNGNLKDTELFAAPIDPTTGVIVGGAQDNGTVVQASPGSTQWSELPGSGGDGGNTNVGPDGSRYYFSDAVLVRDNARVVYADKAGDPAGSGLTQTDKQNWVFLDSSGNYTGFGADTSFYVAVNQDLPSQISQKNVLLCMNDLYESFDGGDTVSNLTNGLRPNWQGSATYATFGGPGNPTAVYVANSSGQLWRRNSFFDSFVQMPTPNWGGNPIRMVADPSSSQTLYVLLNNGQVWQATNAGDNKQVAWKSLTANLDQQTSLFTSIQLYNPSAVPGQGALAVAGFGGVYALQLGSGNPCWHLFGQGLPNVVIPDLHYNSQWDELVAGTLGRGVWTINQSPGTLLLQGATLQINADDTSGKNTVQLRVDPFNNNYLQVNVNNNTEFDGLYSYFSNITISATNPNDEIDIEDIPACLTVTTTSGPNGTLTVGKNGSFQGIQGNLDVTAPGGTVKLTLDDSADASNHPDSSPVTITNSSVTGLSPATISFDPSELAGLQVYVGTNSGASTASTVNVLSTPNPFNLVPGVTTTLLVTGGNDTVNIGNSGSVQGIAGNLVVDNANQRTAVRVDESKDQFALVGMTVDTGTNPYTNVPSEVISLDTNPLVPGSGSDFGRIYLSDAGVRLADIYLGHPTNDSTQSNTVIVRNTWAAITTDIDGGDPYSSASIAGTTGSVIVQDFGTVGIGSATNTLDPIQGPVSVVGQGANTTLNVHDDGTLASQDYGVYATSVHRSNITSPFADNIAPIDYQQIGNLSLYLGQARTGDNQGAVRNIADVFSTARNTSTTTINGGSGENDVTVAPYDSGTGVPLDNTGIQGAVFVRGGGYGILTYYDFLDPNPQKYTLTATQIVDQGFAAVTFDATVHFAGVFTSRNGGSTVNLYSSAKTTDYTGIRPEANDIINVGTPTPQGGTMASLLGSYVTIYANSPSQSSTVTLDDSADTQTGRQVTFSDSQPALGWLVSGLSPSAIAFALGTGSTVTVLGPSPPSGVTLGDTYTIQSTQPGVALSVKGGTGNDTFVLTNTAPLTAAVTINGGGGSDTLQGPDIANTWQISGANAGTLDGNISFASIQNLIGGAGNDTFQFQTGGSVVGSINGGGGTNTLDYTAYVGNILVDLLLNNASLVGQGVSNVANVNGSQGNSLIVGDANTTALTGGTGRNVLIGGGGTETITGGGGFNLLIGGSTIYDSNLTALQDLQQYWDNPNATTLDQLVNPLKSKKGVVVNGQLLMLNSSTVHDDNAVDRLIGGSGANWFIKDKEDTINNGNGPGPNDRLLVI